MISHETFHFHSLDELRQRISDLGLDLELDTDVSPLLMPLQVGKYTLPNRFVVLPMEGCDGREDGSPDELTYRRYRRFAAGGAGILWLEATAVVPEGRANPRQLWLHQNNTGAYARLVEEIYRAAREVHSAGHRPLTIVQLTHSGRYSRPGRRPQPIIAHHSPGLDPRHQLPPDYPLISDSELERLEDAYVEAAVCAARAGFDGVDIKACHRYLISELLASFTRENSRYGGSFENRSRFFRNIVQKIRQAVPGLLVTARLNAYDAMAYPYGFGVNRDHPEKADLSEPIKVAEFLQKTGAPLINLTLGNPYFNPHVNRPFDLPTPGSPLPDEHPLAGIARFTEVVRGLQTALPGMAVIGGGYSWLRQFFPALAAANVRQKAVTLVGIGRMAFAYPEAVRDLMRTGTLDPEKVCVACSACTQIMRDGGRSGCVPRDAAVYEPIYKAGRAEALDTILKWAHDCRQCNDPTCVSHCPAQVNIPKFVGFIAAGHFREAYETIREANVLAATCGYVCPAEVQCESGCLNQHYSASLPIRHLQRWIGRKALDEGWVAEARIMENLRPQKVAVIGAGPAGVAAAAALAQQGYPVALMDKSPHSGGGAADLIPADRLPEDILRKELLGVIQSCGDRIHFQKMAISKTCTMEHLLREGYQAVLLALGLSQAAALPGARRPSSGVYGATDFLTQVKSGAELSPQAQAPAAANRNNNETEPSPAASANIKPNAMEVSPHLDRSGSAAGARSPRSGSFHVKGTVLVLGGGNTAIDAATSALRAGARDVSIVYRRSFAEMPAWPQERDKAIQAGVNILTLTAPLDYAVDAQGKLTGLKVVRTRLASPDQRGRRVPQPIPGSEHVIPAEMVIEAFGQQMEEIVQQGLTGVRLTEEGLIWIRPGSMQTSRPGVFAAGDVVNGGTTVAQAVAEGTWAARDIDRFLRGLA